MDAALREKQIRQQTRTKVLETSGFDGIETVNFRELSMAGLLSWCLPFFPLATDRDRKKTNFQSGPVMSTQAGIHGITAGQGSAV